MFNAKWHLQWLSEKYDLKQKDVSLRLMKCHIQILEELKVSDPTTISGDLYDNMMQEKLS